jgi:site-specific recombinase XerC
MSPYRKQGERTWYLTLATGDAARPWYRMSSGTRDRATAEQMQKMLDLLGVRGRRELWVRDALVARRVHVGTVYDAYVSGTLEALKAQLADVDLAPALDPWVATLRARVTDGTFAEESFRKYVAQVRALVGAALFRTAVTGPALKARLDALPGSGTSRRRHAAAWMSFLDYCVETGLLIANPLRAVKLPKENRTRERYAEWPHVLRLLHALPEGVHRALAAIRHGAGLEMQAALAMRRRDVDLETRVVWAHGRKTSHRDRQAIVLDDACWGIFAAYVRSAGLMPEAEIFPVTHKEHERAQRAAAAVVRTDGVPLRAGYTLHDARHSFAVEMVRRGHEAKLLSANLGHANEALLIKRYGKHRPRAEDLVRAAKRAGGAS